MSGRPVLAAGATSSMNANCHRLSMSMRNFPSRRGRWTRTTMWMPTAFSSSTSLPSSSLPPFFPGFGFFAGEAFPSCCFPSASFASTPGTSSASGSTSASASASLVSLVAAFFPSADFPSLPSSVFIFFSSCPSCPPSFSSFASIVFSFSSFSVSFRFLFALAPATNSARSFSRMYRACSILLTDPAWGSHWSRNTLPSAHSLKKLPTADRRSLSLESSWRFRVVTDFHFVFDLTSSPAFVPKGVKVSSSICAPTGSAARGSLPSLSTASAFFLSSFFASPLAAPSAAAAASFSSSSLACSAHRSITPDANVIRSECDWSVKYTSPTSTSKDDLIAWRRSLRSITRHTLSGVAVHSSLRVHSWNASGELASRRDSGRLWMRLASMSMWYPQKHARRSARDADVLVVPSAFFPSRSSPAAKTAANELSFASRRSWPEVSKSLRSSTCFSKRFSSGGARRLYASIFSTTTMIRNAGWISQSLFEVPNARRT
mmetsp:Transcript_26607/g.64388  ORF Transcript_26607/g.64388 Transcript_26607/m.64388 type:complete len:489 (-) Transcript_26607:873-2339(-)